MKRKTVTKMSVFGIVYIIIIIINLFFSQFYQISLVVKLLIHY
jgi:hypothetical protein